LGFAAVRKAGKSGAMTDTLPGHQLSPLETFAIELAHAAGAAIKPLFRADHGLEDKGAAKGVFDPVTAADKGAEAAIRAAIAARFPDHGVIGEEYGEDRPDADFVWVLDPIDGTRAFISGIPLWTTLIALRFQGRPVVGLIAQPYMDEIFVGSANGSRLIRHGTSRAIHVRPCPSLSHATLGSTDPAAYFTPPEQTSFNAVRKAAKLTRLGGDAYFFALTALGTIDIVVEPSALKAWDIEAAIPLIQGARGYATDWRGQAPGAKGGQIVLAGDRACLDEALTLLAPAAT
jgi:histidinol phosphatase-like enzyme (inositol monophosphatase family)